MKKIFTVPHHVNPTAPKVELGRVPTKLTLVFSNKFKRFIVTRPSRSLRELAGRPHSFALDPCAKLWQVCLAIISYYAIGLVGAEK